MSALCIDPDALRRRKTARWLDLAGYPVIEVAHAAPALEILESEAIDFALLEGGPPGQGGIEFLRDLRRTANVVPVIVVTQTDEVSERVAALNVGADDCVARPFQFEELVARIKAVLRRTGLPRDREVRCGNLVMSVRTRRVHRAGREIPLTAREYELLNLLMANVDRVVSREEILATVWKQPADPSSNIIEVYVRYLRNKIDRTFGKKLIRTVRGRGYSLGSAS